MYAKVSSNLLAGNSSVLLSAITSFTELLDYI